MCLYLKERQMLVAKKDLVCYKILKNANNHLLTYYQHQEIEIGETIFSHLKIQRSHDYDMYNYEINFGLHSFIYKKDVMSFLKKKKKITAQITLCLVKCIIPKGSYYYSGNFLFEEKHFENYASENLKYLEIIKEL